MTTTPSAPTSASPGPKHRAKDFWMRISEGLELSQLWSQFVHETRTSYSLYSRELKHDDLQGLRRGQRWWALFKQFFWAVLMKLSPARRIILLVAIVLLVWPASQVQVSAKEVSFMQGTGPFWGGVLLLGLLVLEIADRVTMKRDLQIAREIQQWLVPEKPPQIPGLDVAFVTRPANTVAGDYYDVLPMGGGHGSPVLLTVADVAGKSIPAALLMATFQASLRTLAASSISLPELVRGLNHYACANSHGGRRFTTAFLGELDPAGGALIYTNAGHNAPLLRRASGAIERLDVGGLPLGIQDDSAYPTATVSLAPGDLLLIFTDGIVEAVSESGEEYGESRLIALLGRYATMPAQEALDSLMRALEYFVGQASQHDDITCMIVRRTS